MPIHARSCAGDLRLTLTSGGRVVDTRFAATRYEAGRIAVLMISSRNGLHDGDMLNIAIADEGETPRGG